MAQVHTGSEWRESVRVTITCWVAPAGRAGARVGRWLALARVRRWLPCQVVKQPQCVADRRIRAADLHIRVVPPGGLSTLSLRRCR